MKDVMATTDTESAGLFPSASSHCSRYCAPDSNTTRLKEMRAMRRRTESSAREAVMATNRQPTNRVYVEQGSERLIWTGRIYLDLPT